jgi:hypothetical protein
MNVSELEVVVRGKWPAMAVHRLCTGQLWRTGGHQVNGMISSLGISQHRSEPIKEEDHGF